MARKHSISPSLPFNWRQRIAEGGREAGRVDEVTGAAKVRRLEKPIRDLERLLGGKMLEFESPEVALTAPRAIVGRSEIA